MEMIKIFEAQERVLQALSNNEMTVQEIRRALKLASRPNHHIKKLLDLGLVEECDQKAVEVLQTGRYGLQIKVRVYRRVKNKPYVVLSTRTKKLLKVVDVESKN